MVLSSQHRLCSIRIIRIKRRKNGFKHLPAIFCQRHVLLLIHCFQFCMETADDCILETVRLDLRPNLHFVGRNIFHIHCLVKTCISICPIRSNGRHQLVVLVRNGILGSFIRNAVNLMIQCFAGSLIRHLTIFLKQIFNLIQKRLFLFIVSRSKMIRSFKHQMLKIVSQTRCLFRVVLSSYSNGNIRLNTRFFLIHSKIHF